MLSLAVSYKFEHKMPCDPAIPALSVYPRKIKIYTHIKPCLQMFIAGLFIITRLGNNSMSLYWRMDKQPGNSTQQNKEQKLLTQRTALMNLKLIVLSERSWTEKATFVCLYDSISTTCQKRLEKVENRSAIARS